MRLISILKTDRKVIIDDSEFEYLSKFSWEYRKSSTGNEYIARRVWRENNGDKKRIHLHMNKEILRIKDMYQYVTNIDGNIFNMQKSNIEIKKRIPIVPSEPIK